MSRIYWHGKHHTSELLGRERAYMGVLCSDLANPILTGRGTGQPHPIERLLPPGKSLFAMRDPNEAARMYLTSLLDDNQLVFSGETHSTFDLTLNTVIATGSPYLALLARLHGTCELHGWVAEGDREWLADLIDGGRERNIFRSGMGWESVAEHLRNGDGGPVVTSYSVCDSFPSAPVGWVGDHEDAWYDLDDETQWDTAFAALNPYLQITPENLTEQTFYPGKTFWDVAESPEWLGLEVESA